MVAALGVRGKKELELFLEKIPRYGSYKRSREQYETPSHIAAHVLWLAHLRRDIESKTIVELGCGTARFSIGALLLGAEKAICIDIDYDIILYAKRIVEGIFSGLTNRLVFVNSDVRDIDLNAVDTVIMNPPFGVHPRSRGIDVLFLKKAMDISKSIYSIHKLTRGIDPIVSELSSSFGFEITYRERINFPIPMMFETHRRRRYTVSTVLFVLRRV